MRKFLAFALLFMFAIVSYGQTVANATANFKFDINDNLTYLRYTGAVADTVSSNDSTWSYTMGIQNLYDALKVECRVELDSVSGTPTSACYLQGKTFVQDDWTTLTTVNWAGTSADTTLSLGYSTAKPYRFYRVHFDCTAGTTQKFKIDEFEVSLYK